MRSSLLALAGLVFIAGGCGSPLRASARWNELTTPHLLIASDVDRVAVIAESRRLETALAALGAAARPDRPLPARVDVLWLRDPDGVAALGVEAARGFYLPHQPDEPTSPPLIVVGCLPGAECEKQLLHELSHALLVDAAPHAPAWVAEGLAAYYATIDVARGSIGRDRDARAQMLMAQPQSLRASLRHLLDAGDDAFHHEWFGPILYNSAHALVALCESDDELRRRFREFLTRLGTGAAAEPAWREAFGGVDLAALETRYVRFVVESERPLLAVPWRAEPTAQPLPSAAVERWIARARPWLTREALVAAGQSLARAVADDSAERHYWSGVYAARWHRWSLAADELAAAATRAPAWEAAAWALARVIARVPGATRDARARSIDALDRVATSAEARAFVLAARRDLPPP